MPARYAELLGPRRGSCGRARAGWPTSTRLSTSPAICGRGRSRPLGGESSGSGSGRGGSIRPRRGTGCARLWRQGQRLDAGELLVRGARRGARLPGAGRRVRVRRVGCSQRRESEVQMESSQKQQTTSERLTNDLRKALEDLRKAGENASGDVRAGIESAVSRIRDASSAATRGGLARSARQLQGLAPEHDGRRARRGREGGSQAPRAASRPGRLEVGRLRSRARLSPAALSPAAVDLGEHALARLAALLLGAKLAKLRPEVLEPRAGPVSG